jgi:hypothetical protein
LGMFLPSGIREKGSYPVWGLYKVLISVIAWGCLFLMSTSV